MLDQKLLGSSNVGRANGGGGGGVHTHLLRVAGGVKLGVLMGGGGAEVHNLWTRCTVCRHYVQFVDPSQFLDTVHSL